MKGKVNVIMKFEELKYDEREEITSLFANWLKNYTHDIIISVISRRDEIINNEFVMNMLRELKAREETEEKEFAHSIGCLLYDFESFKEYDLHNNLLTHSGSYRDILRDLYFN